MSSDPRPKYQQVQPDAIRLRASGVDIRSIAQTLGVSFGTAHRALREADCIPVGNARQHTNAHADAPAAPTAASVRPLVGEASTTRRQDGVSINDTRHANGTRTVTIAGDFRDPNNQRIASLEELLDRFGVDVSEWVITSARVKTWEAMRADKEADLEYKDGNMTGYTRDHGGLHVQTLYSVTATLTREPLVAARDKLHALVTEYAGKLRELTPAAMLQPAPLASSPNPYALVINAADLHYGAYAPVTQTGEGYDRASAEFLALGAVNDLLEKGIRLAGAPERVILALNGDLSHVDTKGRTTTKGTPQDTDGAAVEIMLGALRLARALVERARRAGAPVSVELTYGNHDEIFSALLRQHLTDLYAGQAGVSVNNHQRRTSTLRYGTALLVFEHGDNFNPKGYGATLLAEVRDELAGVKHIEVITGHKHHHFEQDYGGFVHRQGMSISGTDVWHDQRHYRSKRGMTAYVLHREDGITDTLTAPVASLERRH